MEHISLRDVSNYGKGGNTVMWGFLGVIGFIATVVFLVWAIISLFKRNGTAKKRFLSMGISFVIFIIAIVNSGSNSVDTSANKSTEADSNSNVKDTADAKAKAEADAKAKTDKEAKAKADAEAKAKAESEKAKNPNWNVKEMYADKNGNIPLAVKMLKTVGDVSQNGQDAAAGDVFKTPWNYYGKPIKIVGDVGIVQDYPPGSDFASSGILSQVVFSTEDGTIIDLLSTVPSGKVKVGDQISVVAVPVGLFEVPNKLGGNTTQLAVVTNKLN